GVPKASKQRVHGSSSGPDGENRYSVYHQAERGNQNLSERLQQQPGSTDSYRASYDRGGRDVGDHDALGAAQESESLFDTEIEALRRKNSDRLYGRQREGAS